jgi:hypothetical protein
MMHVRAVDVMRKQEALRILAGKLAAIANQGPYDRCANRSPLISRTVLGSAATAVADRGRSSISAWMFVKCQ